MIKRITAIILILLLALYGVVYAFASGGLPSNYIIDDAGLLSTSEIKALNEKAAAISSKYNFPVLVVTKQGIGGMDSVEFSEELYDSMGVGTGSDRSGVMLFISMDERQVVLFTHGYGNDVFTDSRKRLLEETYIGALSEGRYYNSFEAYISGCDKYLTYEEEGSTLSTSEIVTYLSISIILPLMIAFIICKSLEGKMKTAVRQSAARNYIVNGSFNLTRSDDVFSHTTYTRTKIQKQSTGGGGRSGGSGGGTTISKSGSSSRSSKF